MVGRPAELQQWKVRQLQGRLRTPRSCPNPSQTPIVRGDTRKQPRWGHPGEWDVDGDPPDQVTVFLNVLTPVDVDVGLRLPVRVVLHHPSARLLSLRATPVPVLLPVPFPVPLPAPRALDGPGPLVALPQWEGGGGGRLLGPASDDPRRPWEGGTLEGWVGGPRLHRPDRLSDVRVTSSFPGPGRDPALSGQCTPSKWTSSNSSCDGSLNFWWWTSLPAPTSPDSSRGEPPGPRGLPPPSW